MYDKLPAIKLIALKISTLCWFDRYWLLSKLDSNTRVQVKAAFKELKLMGVENPQELINQFSTCRSGLDEPQDGLSKLSTYIEEVKSDEKKVTPKVRSFILDQLKSNNKDLNFSKRDHLS